VGSLSKGGTGGEDAINFGERKNFPTFQPAASGSARMVALEDFQVAKDWKKRKSSGFEKRP